MEKKYFFDKSVDAINSIGDKYDKHIKRKAMKKVDENLKQHNLTADDIEIDDYEAMVNEEMSEIREKYASNTAKVALGALGLDLLFGV